MSEIAKDHDWTKLSVAPYSCKLDALWSVIICNSTPYTCGGTHSHDHSLYGPVCTCPRGNSAMIWRGSRSRCERRLGFDVRCPNKLIVCVLASGHVMKPGLEQVGRREYSQRSRRRVLVDVLHSFQVRCLYCPRLDAFIHPKLDDIDCQTAITTTLLSPK